jgi:group I intron endonuclease
MKSIVNWVIYKIVSPSDKIYIGKTSNYNKRMSYYKNGNSLKQPRLTASFNKYGFNAHDILVIDEFQGDNNLSNEKETFWIEYYKSNCCKYRHGSGLNLTDGGQGTIGYKATDELRKRLSEAHKGLPSGRKGTKASEETKQKLRDYFTGRLNPHKKGKKHSIETLNKMSVSRKGKPNYALKGRKHSEETKIKMSLAKKGKVAHNKGKPMGDHQKELLRIANKGRISSRKGIKFEGTEQERKIKFGQHNIGNSYNKGRKHSAEYGQAVSMRSIGIPNVKLYKPILQFTIEGEFIKEHDSIKNASKETGVSAWTISSIAKEKAKKPNKFIFKYKRA